MTSAIAFMPSSASCPSKAPAPLIGTMAAILTGGCCAEAAVTESNAALAAPTASSVRLLSMCLLPLSVVVLLGGLRRRAQELALQLVDLREPDELDERIVGH